MSASVSNTSSRSTGPRRERHRVARFDPERRVVRLTCRTTRTRTSRSSPARAFPEFRTIFLATFRQMRTGSRRTKKTRTTMTTAMENRSYFQSSESGMTLIAVMMMMTVFAVALLAVAPSVQLSVQREKELEAIRRGEEIADAIRQYIIHHNGAKLPESIDDLLEGLPQETKKRMILRPSAATDPLSEDGKWRLIKADPKVISAFAKRVQVYNNGLLPNNPTQLLDRYSIQLLVNLNTGTEDETEIVDDDFDITTDNQPFIG